MVYCQRRGLPSAVWKKREREGRNPKSKDKASKELCKLLTDQIRQRHVISKWSHPSPCPRKELKEGYCSLNADLNLHITYTLMAFCVWVCVHVWEIVAQVHLKCLIRPFLRNHKGNNLAWPIQWERKFFPEKKTTITVFVKGQIIRWATCLCWWWILTV